MLFTEELQPAAKLIESFSVNKYEESAALYSGKLGSQLFSSQISISDSGYDPENGQFMFFDGEGTVRTQPLNLIENGKFVSLISDLRFGNKFKRPSTGNGQRVYNRGVILGPRSLRIGKGQRPWREIVKGLDKCIIAMICAGGDSNDLGEFSSPVQVGYLLEKGEVVGRTPELSLKTSVDSYLNSGLVEVASDGFTSGSPSACVISEMDILVK